MAAFVAVVDVGLDGGGEVGDGGEDAPADGLVGEEGKEALDEVWARSSWSGWSAGGSAGCGPARR